MKVLVTGGAGYLGSHVVRILQRVGEQVTVFDNLTYADEYRGEASFVFGDVTDAALVHRQIAEHDVVIWLAAIVGDAACAADPSRAIAVNQESVRAIVSFNKPAVFASSCSVYGVSGDEVDESAPLVPQSLYAETKIKAEQYLAGTPTAILRFGTLYGASERMRFDLVVNAMTRDAVVRGQFNVYGGHQRRPLLAVQDAAGFVALQAVSEVPHPGVYNVASSNLSINEIGKVVQHSTGARVNVMETESQDHRDYVVGTRLATRHGFNPTHSIAEAVKEISELILSHRVKDPYATRYSNASRFIQ